MIRFLSAVQDWYISMFNKKVRLASHIDLERLCWTSEPLVLFLSNWVIIYVLSTCLIKTAILFIMSAITGSSSRLFLSLHSWTDCSCKRKATTAKEYLFWTTLQLCKTVLDIRLRGMIWKTLHMMFMISDQHLKLKTIKSNP